MKQSEESKQEEAKEEPKIKVIGQGYHIERWPKVAAKEEKLYTDLELSLMDGNRDKLALCMENNTVLTKELQSLRDQLAVEQDRRNASEMADRIIINDLRDQLAAKEKTALSDINNLLEENMELRDHMKQREEEAWVEGYKVGKSASVEYGDEIKVLKEALRESLTMLDGFRSYLKTLDYKDWTEKEKLLYKESEPFEDKARKLL